VGNQAAQERKRDHNQEKRVSGGAGVGPPSKSAGMDNKGSYVYSTGDGGVDGVVVGGGGGGVDVVVVVVA